MLKTIEIKTGQRRFFDITAQVQNAVAASGVAEGLCVVHCPETDAGLVLADVHPDLHEDILDDFARMMPPRTDTVFRGTPEKTAAACQRAWAGAAKDLIVTGGQLRLCEKQGLFLADYSAGAARTVLVKIFKNA